MITKIITHDGIFHADDVMSVALMLECIRPKIQVERTRNISPDEFSNPDIWIIDVGRQYNRALNNYDHHQDKTLPASCILILNQMHSMEYISIELYRTLFDALVEISEIDCNGPIGKNGFQFNSLIKSFNNLEDGFDKALWVCRNYIKSCKADVEKTEQSLKIWNEGESVSCYIKVCSEFPAHWKRYEQHPLLIFPNEGKWTLISANSDHFPIWATGKELFIHSNKFLAVFETKADAIECAQASAYNAVG